VFERRVGLLVGHFGSGKTEIAVNQALRRAESGARVTLADLDVVKPYFRSRAARETLAAAGVELIAPAGEHIYADLPIIVPEIRSRVREPGRELVVDVGGDDSGARVLGSLADVLPVEHTDCLLVLNFCRPFTRDPEEAEAMVRRIESVSRLEVRGLVSNSHLMDDTTADVVVEGYRMAVETGRRLGVPVRAVTAGRGMDNGLDPESFSCPLVWLERVIVSPCEAAPRQRSSGPLFVLS
jgi:hypothetical protein